MKKKTAAKKELDIHTMTKKELEALPWRDRFDSPILCDNIVIIPGSGRKSKLHDSGFRCLDFVAVKRAVPLCRLSGCSDVIHIDGIGGYGYGWFEKYHSVPRLVEPHSWSIDCLPISGLLRLFVSGCDLIIGAALSSFEIYAIKQAAEEKGIALNSSQQAAARPLETAGVPGKE